MTLTQRGKYYRDCSLYERAYWFFLEAAYSEGDMEAIENIGLLYLYGEYPRQDFTKAFKYLRKAYAATGNARMIGKIMEARKDISEDANGRMQYKEFLEFLAESGETRAYILMAQEYGEGIIFPYSIDMKIECLKAAADRGESFGYECLGEMYFKGDGVERCYKKAYEFFNMTDCNSSFVRPYCLAEMYRKGLYVEKKVDKAAEYYAWIANAEVHMKACDPYYLRACELLAKLGKMGNYYGILAKSG